LGLQGQDNALGELCVLLLLRVAGLALATHSMSRRLLLLLLDMLQTLTVCVD
jgi:hypothetical protein